MTREGMPKELGILLQLLALTQGLKKNQGSMEREEMLIPIAQATDEQLLAYQTWFEEAQVFGETECSRIHKLAEADLLTRELAMKHEEGHERLNEKKDQLWAAMYKAHKLEPSESYSINRVTGVISRAVTVPRTPPTNTPH